MRRTLCPLSYRSMSPGEDSNLRTRFTGPESYRWTTEATTGVLGIEPRTLGFKGPCSTD